MSPGNIERHILAMAQMEDRKGGNLVLVAREVRTHSS